MRVTVVVGSEKLRLPVSDGSKTIAWLQAEIIKRWEKKHKGEYLNISEIRTGDNTRLDNEDQIIGVCKEDERLVAILGVGAEKEVGPGDMIHQYYLRALIGEGTYGRVYKANDLNLNRPVAVKVLRRSKANEVNTRRFLREAELNGSLSFSPHIVTVHDFGRTRGGTLFIVMEMLRGRPLNELLDERIANKQPFTPLECIHILSPVLRGLHAAHKHVPMIVHRDLKPDNIWINDVSAYQHFPRPSEHLTKIMDFGIAIHDEITHETLACGTRMYSSPEQTRKNSKLDGRSDIWSCGVILYQLLSLLVDVPFDPVDLILSKSAVPPLEKYTATRISPQMHAIVMKALEVDLMKRFQSAEEMLDALHAEEMRIVGRGDKSNTVMQTKRESKGNANDDTPTPPPPSHTATTTTTVDPHPSPSQTISPVAAAAVTTPRAPPPPAAVHPRFSRGRSHVPFSSNDSPPINSKL